MQGAPQRSILWSTAFRCALAETFPMAEA